jgi:hypothetical protein
MVIVLLVIAWALVEAVAAVMKAAHATTRRRARRNIFTGPFDLST